MIWGTTIGVIKEDTRILDCSASGNSLIQDLFEKVLVVRASYGEVLNSDRILQKGGAASLFK